MMVWEEEDAAVENPVENPANPVESPAKPNVNVESPAKPNVSVENPENNSFVFYIYFINKYKWPIFQITN